MVIAWNRVWKNASNGKIILWMLVDVVSIKILENYQFIQEL
jgi:hypothetical protein